MLPLELGHLLGRHQPGVIVLVAGERQAKALDRVRDETVRPVVVAHRLERFAHQIEVVAAEIGHELRQRVVVALGEQGADPGEVAEIVLQALAPARAPLNVSAE